MELENSIETIPPLIEPLLQNYKGAELRFQEREKELSLDFSIGTGANQCNISISLTPESPGKTLMALEVVTVDDPAVLKIPDKAIKKIEILIKDILFHIVAELNIKNKARTVEKGLACPKCKQLNDIDSKFCKECGYNFLEVSQSSPRIPRKPSTGEAGPASPRIPQKPSIDVASSSSPSVEKSVEIIKPTSQTEEDIIDQLNRKYVLKYECTLCDKSCYYLNPFILLLKDIKNLREPFEKFDTFLNDKDMDKFSDYIYEYAAKQMKKYPKFKPEELRLIAFCLFSILSWHILEKASKSVRLTFAEKMKERINFRFKKDFPTSDIADVDLDKATPTIKTGTLHIEENRCPYCYTRFDDRILRLKVKGYEVECPVCGKML